VIEAARAWVEAVHPSAPHLVRTLEWIDRLAPDAREALRIAALVHDAERAFPEPGSHWTPRDHWDVDEYVRWHQDRSAAIAAGWLAEQGAAPELVEDVRRLVAAHEDGGWPEADVLQAADSLSFLEVMVPAIAAWPADRAEGKLRYMAERVSVAREPAADRLARALAQLRA
jgi:hypothetical protein